jgi:hypothetical protein
VEPTAGGLLSIAYKLAEACHKKPQTMHRKVVEDVTRAVTKAQILERWLYARPARRHKQT